MATWVVRYTTSIEIAVTVEADDEDTAAERSWAVAAEYAETVHGDGQDVRASVSLDGIGADEIEPQDPAI